MSQEKTPEEYMRMLEAEKTPDLPPVARVNSPDSTTPGEQPQDPEKIPVFGAARFSVVVNGVACTIPVDAGFPKPIT